MKRIILFISAMLACSAFTAYAQESVSVAVKNTGENGSLSRQIIVTGVFDTPDDNVMLAVHDSNGGLTVLEQETTDKDGTVMFTFPCEAVDSYTGYVNSETGNVKLPFDFQILSAEEYDAIAEELKNADENTIAGIIDEYIDELCLDTKYYTEEKKAEIAANMLEEKGNITPNTINECFDKSVLYAYLFGDEMVEVKNEVLGYYNNIHYNIDNQDGAKKIYDSFLALDDETKAKVYSRLGENKPVSLTDFADAFNEAVVLTAVSELDNERLDIFFIDNSDLVELEDYSEYTMVRRNTYLNEIKNSGATSISEIVQAYNNAVQEANNQDSSSSSGGAGGSGGSGGGGGSSSGGSSGQAIGLPVTQPQKTQETPQQEAAAVKTGFTDLAGYEWAEQAINKLYERSIVSGKSEGMFCPGDNITRAEFVTMVVLAFNLLDENAECSFDDVPKQHWSYKYTASGYIAGIVSGVDDNNFGGDEKITREQMAAILYRTIRSVKQLDVLENIQNELRDFDSVSAYAKNSVIMLSNLGIINGFEDGSFAPKNNATRAEVSVMINNALEVLSDA